MSLLQETIDLSHLYGVRPSRSRGQNFLVDEKVYDKIIKAAELTKKDTVLEVGPGLGFLTLHLSKVVDSVIAVELDTKLAEALENRLSLEGASGVHIFNEDVMNFSGAWVKAAAGVLENIIVVANLPYSITSTFLRFFVGGNREHISPQRFILMLQKEVAERLTAQAGAMSILAVSVQLYTDPEIIFIVSKKSFWPIPAIDSAVVRLTRTDRWLKALAESGGDDESLMRLVRIGFSARRKMLKANLAGGYQLPASETMKRLEQAGISPTARAQELSVADWIKLLPLFLPNGIIKSK